MVIGQERSLVELLFLDGQCLSGVVVLVVMYSIYDESCSFLVSLVL